MKHYETPEMQVHCFELTDVIITSVTDGGVGGAPGASDGDVPGISGGGNNKW